MLLFAFLLWANAQKTSYKVVDVSVLDIQFQAALYTVEFEQQLVLSEKGPIEDFPLLESSKLQRGSARLLCGNTVFESFPDPNIRGAPRYFYPMPAVKQSASTLFKVFGRTLDPELVEPRPNTFIGLKIIKNFNKKTLQWESYMSGADPANCRVQYLPLNFTTDIVTKTVHSTCDLAKFSRINEQIQSAMTLFDGFTDKTDIKAATWNLAALLAHEDYTNCQEMVSSMIKSTDTISSVFSDGCFAEKGSKEWRDDPCCNFELRSSQCCASKTAKVLNQPLIEPLEQCTDKRVPNALQKLDYFQRQALYGTCDRMALEAGADWSVTDRLTRFVDVCYEELFGNNTRCFSDVNCYTTCDMSTHRCIPPYDDADVYLLQCMNDNIDPIMLTYWKRQLHVPQSRRITVDDLRAQQSHLYDESCVGPTAWQYNERWNSEACTPDDSDDCICYKNYAQELTRNVRQKHSWEHSQYTGLLRKREIPQSAGKSCYRNYRIESDPQACEQSSFQSADKPYCAEKHGVKIGSEPVCYSWVRNMRKCRKLGGVPLNGDKKRCMFPELSKQSECLPPKFCGNISTTHNGELLCANKCVFEHVESAEECTLLPRIRNRNAWWNGHIQACQIDLNKRQCKKAKQTTWFKNRNFLPGKFLTEESCTSPDVSEMACDSPCPKACAPVQGSIGMLCYLQNITESDCHFQNGDYDQEYSVCLFDDHRTEDDCMSLTNIFDNHTIIYESCDQLDTVDMCVDLFGLSKYAQNRLQCAPDYWSTCETESACKASGVCDDWELYNWYQDNAQEGVCIFPYDDSGVLLNLKCKKGVYSKLGCIDYTVVREDDCQGLEGASWVYRAYTQRDCIRHGSACSEYRDWELTPKTPGQCLGCGGIVKPHYNWRAGNWAKVDVSNRQWIASEKANKWATVLNWTKLHAQLKIVATTVVQKTMKSSLMCKFNPISKLVQQISCSCMTNSPACFNTIQIPVGEKYAFTNENRQRIRWLNAQILTDIPAEIDSGLVTGSIIPFYPPNNDRLQVRSPSNPNQWEVVTNNVDYIVGQLVSDGVSVTFPVNTTINLCINLDPLIPKDPEMIYPQPDFATFNASGMEKYTPINATVIIMGNMSQYCTDISESGTYFAILRAEPWINITGGLDPPTAAPSAAPSATPTASPTASPTAAPTPAPTLTPSAAPTTLAPTFPPTLAPNQGLSIAGWVLIILGVLALLVIVILLIYMSTRTYAPKQQRVGQQIRKKKSKHLRRKYGSKTN